MTDVSRFTILYLETMKRFILSFSLILFFTSFHKFPQTTAWIRINQLGYTPNGIKAAVYCSKEQLTIDNWQLKDANTNQIVYSGADWSMVLCTEVFTAILSVLLCTDLINMQIFKANLLFIMTTMVITAPMNQPWMERPH